MAPHALEDPTGSRPRTPNLFVVGAMKASTTTLCELLHRHAEIWFPAEKEPGYHSGPKTAERAAGYRALYRGAPVEARYLGDGSTDYSRWPHVRDVPERIARDAPDARILYIVRDPVERTVSHFQHSSAWGHYPRGARLEDVLVRDPILVDTSRYDLQLRQFERVFDPLRILVLVVEELHHDPRATLDRVAAFLGLRPFEPDVLPSPGTLGAKNSAEHLRQVVTGQRLLARLPGARALRRVVPDAWQRRLHGLGAPSPAPAPSEAVRALLLDLLAPDLERLHARLGARIAAWPSLRALEARP